MSGNYRVRLAKMAPYARRDTEQEFKRETYGYTCLSIVTLHLQGLYPHDLLLISPTYRHLSPFVLYVLLVSIWLGSLSGVIISFALATDLTRKKSSKKSSRCLDNGGNLT